MSVCCSANSGLPPVVGILEPGFADDRIERDILAPLGAEVRYCPWGGDRVALLEHLRQLRIVMLRDVPVLDAEAIGQMREQSGIVRYGVGVDTVDLEAARRRGIKVANVPDYGAEIEVSDHAAALTLALVRRVVTRDAQVRAGQWNLAQKEAMYRLAGATLGLVGFGKIARGYLQRMRGFDVAEVLVHDPYVTDDFVARFGAKRVAFDVLCRRARIISLHAPATPETNKLVDRRALGLMNARTCLINTSRGSLVDLPALAEALRNGQIFGAALDVLSPEPMAADCPLKGLKNVILSDHTAWYSESSVKTLQEKAAQAAYEMLTTGTPTHWVNAW